MKEVKITVPEIGESVSEVLVYKWLKQAGDMVEKDEEIVTIETDKATVSLNAEEKGTLEIYTKDGEVAKVGQVIGRINSYFWSI